jgi:hypothetical protein
MSGDQGQDRGPVRVSLRRGQSKRDGKDARPETIDDPRCAVTPLRPEEPARFNPDTLESLCRRIGETRAEAEVARALERISTTLAALDTLEEEADSTLMAATLRSLVRDADMIGMVTLARVSRNVLACLGTSDSRAYSATLARLSRVGDRSMLSVWELEDLSG